MTFRDPNHGPGKNSTRQADLESAWTRTITSRTLAGGALLAVVAFFIHKREFSLGFLSGSLLAVLNLHSLKFLTGKLLKGGEKGGPRPFWFGNALRWLLLALACWLFLLVSPLCLAGAMASYLWFLVVLAWVGWSSASASSKD